MRKTGVLFFLALFPLLSWAQYQANFDYDYAGNRTAHVIVIDDYRSQSGFSDNNIQYNTVFSDRIDGHRVSIDVAVGTSQLRIGILGISDTDVCRVSIYDMRGKQMMSQQLKQEQTVLDLSSLTKGLYIIKLDVNNESISRKILKR